MKFSTYAHMSQEANPRNHVSFCLSAIWPINRYVITAFGFVSFRTVFFLLPFINLLQIWALFGMCLWKDSQGLNALRPDDGNLICLRQLFGHRWIDADFDASIVFWVKSVCLVAYEIVSDVYLKGSGNPYTVKGVVERGRWLFFLEVPSGCQTRPKIWMIFLVLSAFWLTLMSDKKCKNLHGNGGFSAPIVVRVFRKFSIQLDRSLSGVCGCPHPPRQPIHPQQ